MGDLNDRLVDIVEKIIDYIESERHGDDPKDKKKYYYNLTDLEKKWIAMAVDIAAGELIPEEYYETGPACGYCGYCSDCDFSFGPEVLDSDINMEDFKLPPLKGKRK